MNLLQFTSIHDTMLVSAQRKAPGCCEHREGRAAKGSASMRTKSTAPLSPGVYTIAGRGYLVAPDGAVRSVRPSGRTGRSVVARVTPGGLQVTGNGTEGG